MQKTQLLIVAIITVILLAVFTYLILIHPIGSGGTTAANHSGYSLYSNS